MLKIRNRLILLLLPALLSSNALASTQQYNNYLQTAYKALRNNDYKTAIRYYNSAAKLYPNEPDIYNNLGVAYVRIDDLKNAELNYKKAIKMEPSNAYAYSNLSIIYEKQKRYLEAAKCIEKYAKLTPSDKNVYYHLTELYFKAGNKELCLKNGEKYAQYNPDKFDSYCILAEKCKGFGDFDRAVYYYEKALAVNNTDQNHNPDSDNQMQNENLPYVLQELRECQYKIRIANITPATKAPASLYNLVSTSDVLRYRDTFDKLYEMLDLLWNDQDGRILLSTIIKYKIPIKVNYGGVKQTNAYLKESCKKTALGYLSMVPLPLVVAAPLALSNALLHTDVKKEKTITVNLGEEIIHRYKDPQSTYHDNMYAIMSVMHEAGHAAALTIEDNYKDSIEEEMTVSMIGFNTASKILLGRPLSRNESLDCAKNSYKALMSDEHKSLPLYNNFRNTISKLGVNLYNYDTYADLQRLQQEASY